MRARVVCVRVCMCAFECMHRGCVHAFCVACWREEGAAEALEGI